MVSARASVALITVLGFLPGCSVAFGRSSPEPLVVSGHRVHSLPSAGTTRIGVYDDEAGTCFAYIGKSSGGSYCMRAVGPQGWAVEVELLSDLGGSAVLLLAGRAETTQVRLPRPGRSALVVALHRVPGISSAVTAVAVDAGTLDLTANGVTAYDAEGNLLGHTHDCAGLGGPADCGPYDGLIDRTLPRPSP